MIVIGVIPRSVVEVVCMVEFSFSFSLSENGTFSFLALALAFRFFYFLEYSDQLSIRFVVLGYRYQFHHCCLYLDFCCYLLIIGLHAYTQ